MPHVVTDSHGSSLDPPPLTPTRPVCRHCRRGTANRARGLCWGCYQDPGVRALYPSTSKYAVRGLGNGNRAAPPAAQPTSMPAGTLARMREYRRRLLRGESLHHPGDNPAIGRDGELRPFHGLHYRGGEDDGLETAT